MKKVISVVLLVFLFACFSVQLTQIALKLTPNKEAQVTEIVNGVSWFDNNGKRIEAHGGGWLLVGDTYYWYGENGKALPDAQHGVNCYSSKDLYNWKFEGLVFSQTDVQNVSAKGPYIVERPKVLYNKPTSKYVLWFHLDTDGYTLRSVGVATSETPVGPFKFVKGFRPDGLESLDQSLFLDDDGSAYHVRSVENQYIGISRLTDDFLGTTGGIISRTYVPREGPAIFKYNGNYYMITSHLTGWAPNAMDMFKTGNTLKGAVWTSIGNPTNNPTTYDTQSTEVLTFKNTLIYLGDKWNFSGPGGLANASYVWLPIIVDGDKFTIPYKASWKLP